MYVRHLECSRCLNIYSHGDLHNLCPKCAAPLLVRYHLDRIGADFEKSMLPGRRPDLWRYAEALPVDGDQDILTLGEGWTPLLPAPHAADKYAVEGLFIKDESQNPTGSFKDRGLVMAVALAKKLGAKHLCIPTAGNAGGALAAYCAQAGLKAHIFMPEDTPAANQLEAVVSGAEVQLVDGLISDAAKLMAKHMETEDWFDVSTLKEPYRIEGKKTMGYEIAEQFNWELPDVVLYPTGGGTGLIGMWKAFDEMEEMGWIGQKRPRLVSVQSKGCAPIVRAYEAGSEDSDFWQGAETFAAGIRVPKAVGDFLILRAIQETVGCAVAVSEEDILASIFDLGQSEGLFVCPEGAACWAAFKKLRESEWIRPSDVTVVFNTGAGHKYIDAIQGMLHPNRT